MVHNSFLGLLILWSLMINNLNSASFSVEVASILLTLGPYGLICNAVVVQNFRFCYPLTEFFTSGKELTEKS